MITRTIRVTQKDIREGGIRCDNCPIALAICRALHRGQSAVCVDEVSISVGCLETYTPKRAANFIGRYDHGKTVRPFKFRLCLK